ncbi:MAG: PaaI family thioesterase [Phycisphaerales bacterium]
MSDSAKHAVSSSFARQPLMATLGARLIEVADGLVRIELPITPAITQQHGFAHAGAVAAIADSACGYAALTKIPPGSEVLSIEFKVNLLAPAAGDRLVATAKVIRAGRTISVCQAEVESFTGETRKLVALMQATMIRAEPTSQST